LSNDTTLLFGLAGVRVERVVLGPDGIREVHVQTADEGASGCPSCGVLSLSMKGNVATAPRDIPYGTRPVAVVWHKRRWRCREVLCERQSFTEALPSGARTTRRLAWRCWPACGHVVDEPAIGAAPADMPHGGDDQPGAQPRPRAPPGAGSWPAVLGGRRDHGATQDERLTVAGSGRLVW
jgi:hypothetical protein